MSVRDSAAACFSALEKRLWPGMLRWYAMPSARSRPLPRGPALQHLLALGEEGVLLDLPVLDGHRPSPWVGGFQPAISTSSSCTSSRAPRAPRAASDSKSAARLPRRGEQIVLVAVVGAGAGDEGDPLLRTLGGLEQRRGREPARGAEVAPAADELAHGAEVLALLEVGFAFRGEDPHEGARVAVQGVVDASGGEGFVAGPVLLGFLQVARVGPRAGRGKPRGRPSPPRPAGAARRLRPSSPRNGPDTRMPRSPSTVRLTAGSLKPRRITRSADGWSEVLE